ncbi:DUF2490 domain-containing protein [Hydrotalea sp.]|uniref:DUF2490 domain-containing protein n=1 Tax=Hydrotalea sp. TaxID=2881279 RepID=UPI00261CF0F8|nr:DUF2490 domain-containing protein [Hydrotalea sp.]
MLKNSMLFRQLIYTISLSGFCCQVAAQSVNTSSAAVWTGYFYSIPVTEKWKILGDAQFRSKYGFSQLSQILARSGVSYAIQPNWTISAGAAYFKSSGQLHNENIFLDEYRLWQENAVQFYFHHITLSNRTRWEERWLQKKLEDVTNSFSYANRWRNKTTLTFPFSAVYSGEVGSEVMVVANQSNAVDLLRAFAGIYMVCKPSFIVQLQYLYQCQYKSIDAIHYRDNQHIVRLNIIQKFPQKL